METLMDGGGVFIVQEKTWRQKLAKKFKREKPKSDQPTADDSPPKPEEQNLRRRRTATTPPAPVQHVVAATASDLDDELAGLSIPQLHALEAELKKKIAADQARSSSEDVSPPLPPRPSKYTAGFCSNLKSLMPTICGVAPLSPNTRHRAGSEGSLSSTAMPEQPVAESSITNVVDFPLPSMVASYASADTAQKDAVNIHI